MKKVFLFLFLLFIAAFSAPATRVLQNGLQGYEGCEDAYMFLGMPADNTGSEEILYIAECPT